MILVTTTVFWKQQGEKKRNVIRGFPHSYNPHAGNAAWLGVTSNTLSETITSTWSELKKSVKFPGYIDDFDLIKNQKPKTLYGHPSVFTLLFSQSEKPTGDFAQGTTESTHCT